MKVVALKIVFKDGLRCECLRKTASHTSIEIQLYKVLDKKAMADVRVHLISIKQERNRGSTT